MYFWAAFMKRFHYVFLNFCHTQWRYPSKHSFTNTFLARIILSKTVWKTSTLFVIPKDILLCWNNCSETSNEVYFCLFFIWKLIVSIFQTQHFIFCLLYKLPKATLMHLYLLPQPTLYYEWRASYTVYYAFYSKW